MSRSSRPGGLLFQGFLRHCPSVQAFEPLSLASPGHLSARLSVIGDRRGGTVGSSSSREHVGVTTRDSGRVTVNPTPSAWLTGFLVSRPTASVKVGTQRPAAGPVGASRQHPWTAARAQGQPLTGCPGAEVRVRVWPSSRAHRHGWPGWRGWRRAPRGRRGRGLGRQAGLNAPGNSAPDPCCVASGKSPPLPVSHWPRPEN